MSSLTSTVAIDKSYTMPRTSTTISTSMPVLTLPCHRATIFHSVQVRTTSSWCTIIISQWPSRRTTVPKNLSHLTVPLDLNMSQHSHRYTAQIKWSHSRPRTWKFMIFTQEMHPNLRKTFNLQPLHFSTGAFKWGPSSPDKYITHKLISMGTSLAPPKSNNKI